MLKTRRIREVIVSTNDEIFHERMGTGWTRFALARDEAEKGGERENEPNHLCKVSWCSWRDDYNLSRPFQKVNFGRGGHRFALGGRALPCSSGCPPEALSPAGSKERFKRDKCRSDLSKWRGGVKGW